MADAIHAGARPALTALNAEQVRRAGPRYTPGTTPGAPNIPIRSLRLATSCLALDDGFRAQLRRLRRDLAEQTRYIPPWLEERIEGWVASPAALLNALDRLAGADATNVEATAACAGRMMVRLSQPLERLRTRMLAAERESAAREESARERRASHQSDGARAAAGA